MGGDQWVSGLSDLDARPTRSQTGLGAQPPRFRGPAMRPPGVRRTSVCAGGAGNGPASVLG